MPRRSLAASAAVAALAVGLRAGSASAVEFECGAFLRMHGLLRRASAACGYAAYNPQIVERARSCFGEVGAGPGAREMRAGAAQFDRMDAIRDRDAFCADLARRFPMVVRP